MKLDAVNSEVAEVKLLYKSKQKPSERPKILKSQDAIKIFQAIEEYNFNMEFKEMFYAMYVSRANKVLSVLKISEGGSTGTVVDTKQVLQGAILQNAHGIILSHNHPSGNTTPSESDIRLTKNLQAAAKLIDCQILDHIIIATDDKFLSFADEGLL